jgi:hypothetical protein
MKKSLFMISIVIGLSISMMTGSALSTIPLLPVYSSPEQQSDDEQQEEPTDEEPTDEEPTDEEPADEPEPEPSLPPSTSAQQPELPDQASNVSLSGYPYPHILPPTGLTENGDEENTTQTEQTVAERGGGNPLKGLNVIPQTGEKPLPPCTPGGPTPCLVKK